MSSYMVQWRGEEYGPYPLETLRTKLAAGDFFPWQSARVVEDGKHIEYSTVGDVIVAEDGPANALPTFQSYLAQIKERAEAAPRDWRWQSDLATAHQKLGAVLAKLGRADEAIHNYRAALAIVEEVLKLCPDDRTFQIEVARFNYDLAVSGDEPARRYALVVDILMPLEDRLDGEESELLAGAATALAKLRVL